jgi:hypothetical protein
MEGAEDARRHRAGGVFPDYELTDHTRIRWKLSELQGQGHGKVVK